jgi:hypothetical protein
VLTRFGYKRPVYATPATIALTERSPRPLERTEPEVTQPDRTDDQLNNPDRQDDVLQLIALQAVVETEAVAVKQRRADEALRHVAGIW